MFSAQSAPEGEDWGEGMLRVGIGKGLQGQIGRVYVLGDGATGKVVGKRLSV